MSTSNRVLARYLTANRLVEAFAKFHPVYNVVSKAKKIAEKSFAQAKRYVDIASRAGGYKGDSSKIQPNLNKAFEAVDTLVRAAEGMHEPVKKFLADYAKDLESDYRKRVYTDLVKWSDKMYSFLGKTITDERFKTKFQKDSYGFGGFIDGTVSELYFSLLSLAGASELASKIPLKGPDQVAPNASPEDRFRAHMTRDIISMAKASAKKLGNKPGPCAVLGCNVLEDVNAHSAYSAIMGLVEHYYDNLTEEDGKTVQGLVGRVSGALDWGIVEAGAFCAAIMKASSAPEAERVIDILAKAFDELTKD
jgi:hypothetical protein